MKTKLGFIGCGNMGKAMIGGIVKSKLYEASNIIVSNPSDSSLVEVKQKYGVMTTSDNTEVAEAADILVLSVKPNKYEDVIEEIKESVRTETVIVAIAAGVSVSKVCEYFGREVKVVRAMPNTPAFVNEAMSALCRNKNVSDDEFEQVDKIFSAFGKTEVLEEKLMDAVTGVSGSSPAYVYMFIEALADGAVLNGIPREKAYRMAAQSVFGAAKMVIETGKHPGKLKDEVCSPGGTTIEAVYALEKNNFRGTVMDAVCKCTEKSKSMSHKHFGKE